VTLHHLANGTGHCQPKGGGLIMATERNLNYTAPRNCFLFGKYPYQDLSFGFTIYSPSTIYSSIPYSKMKILQSRFKFFSAFTFCLSFLLDILLPFYVSLSLSLSLAHSLTLLFLGRQKQQQNGKIMIRIIFKFD